MYTEHDFLSSIKPALLAVPALGDEVASTGDELAEVNVIWKSISEAVGAPVTAAAAAYPASPTMTTPNAGSSQERRSPTMKQIAMRGSRFSSAKSRLRADEGGPN